jgi:gliding motility-associated-like protein
LNGLGFGFKGSALIDWISIKDASDNSVYFEDFNSCTNFARPAACNTSSLTVSANAPCEGSNLSLSSSVQGSAYSWTGPNGFTSTSANPIISNVTASAAGRYTLTTNINACQTLTNFVDVAITPMSTRDTSVNICQGQNHLLPNGQSVSTNGIYTNTVTPLNSCSYVLKTHLNVTPISVMDTSITICQGQFYTRLNGQQVTRQGLYEDTLRPAGSCWSVRRTNLFVRPAPSVFLGNDTTLCAGATHLLNVGNPSGSILWQNGSTNSTLEVRNAGLYSIRIAHIDGCISTDSIEINVAPNPIVNLGRDTTICYGNYVQLNAGNPGHRYQWNDGITTQTRQINQTRLHSVLVTSVFGCTGRDTIQVTVADSMTAQITTESEITCNNLCNGKVVAATNSIYTSRYSWSNGGTTARQANLCTGRYAVTVQDSLGCVAQKQVNIANPAAIQALTFVTSNYNGVPISCKGRQDGTAKVISSGGTGSHTTEWLTNPRQSTINATELGAGIHRVVITDVNGCKDTATVQLTEPDSIQVNLAPTFPICEGNQDGKILFNALRGGMAPYSLLWNGTTVPSITSGYQLTGLKVNLYPMQIKDVNNCLSLPFEARIVSVPKLKIIISNDTVIKLGDSLKILSKVTNRSNALLTCKWSPTNTLSCDSCAETIAKPIHPTDYRVVWKDIYGCTSDSLVKVKVSTENVVFIPNAFSPNGDENNDRLIVYGSKAVRRILEFKIYNRWGNLVFADSDFAPNDEHRGWDGIFRGKESSLDVFIWHVTLELIDGTMRTVTGDTTIIK